MIKLYNTLTKKLEEFKPLKDKKVGMYYCGPTVYWIQHIGNLRGMFCADLAVRVLKYLGYKIKFVRNYTDVGHLVSDDDFGEDKMAKGVMREGLTPQKIANKYIKIYEQDTRELNLKAPDFKPRATKHIKEMIKMVQKLLNSGYAYATDLAIYFDVTRAKNYNQLSHQNLEEQIKGAGSGEVEDPNKKHDADFALWFFKAGRHKNALQTWSSPFKSPLVKNGEGFPGWHIECSAMSKKYLGSTLDIHMGGIEHIPVHHTNEIAQSEAANGVKFVNYWLHNEHLLVNGGKMSKSQGTGFSLQEVKNKGFKPLTLRYFFLQAHYRSKQNFTWEALISAQNGLEHLYHQVVELGKKKGSINIEFKNKFIQAISDDFNSPQALAILQEVLKSKLSNADKLATILDFDKVLGLDLSKVKKGKKYTLKTSKGEFNITTFPSDLELTKKVRELIIEREDARKNKDWEKSDELRDKISWLGYLVEDTEQGAVIKKK